VVVSVSLIGYLTLVGLMEMRLSIAYLVGVFVLAAVSWLDDLYSIAVVWRLITHLLVATFVVYVEGSWSVISFGSGLSVSLDGAGSIVSILWIVWMINAYNFMDGIDGLAGIQGIVASAAWGLIAARQQSGIYLYALILCACLSGFILHNWHPAKIFIGDVGSAFLGFTFATFPLMLAHESPADSELLPTVSILILWPFIFDTALTLVGRIYRRKYFWQAHREHLYQRLVISGLSQQTVTAIYGLFAIVTSSASLLLFSKAEIWRFYVIGLVLVMSILLTLVVARLHRIANRVKIPHDAY
jgi:UDP-N-acetylmuramyl pentapeptide phosphotransferase/UDP-N-acetylglucosamine-1-phosphate transferase